MIWQMDLLLILSGREREWQMEGKSKGNIWKGGQGGRVCDGPRVLDEPCG